MLSRTRISIFITFLVALAVWVGGGVFDSISSHPAWYANPATYVRGTVVTEGTINPWPFTTAVMALCTLAVLAAFARYRGPGRREVLAAALGTFVILVATGVYFVPTLMRLADHAALSDAQIASMSRMWMGLNVIRIILVLALFVYGLIGLMRMGQPRLEPARS
ncbi:anthrone oxygenase family protein [Longimicrobium sp.]|uniref:anthrone oxygenase family protein n=1 Tax=Longimicrobium sp. TaxID=2029185 RepID=UPI003B3BB859